MISQDPGGILMISQDLRGILMISQDPRGSLVISQDLRGILVISQDFRGILMIPKDLRSHCTHPTTTTRSEIYKAKCPPTCQTLRSVPGQAPSSFPSSHSRSQKKFGTFWGAAAGVEQEGSRLASPGSLSPGRAAH